MRYIRRRFNAGETIDAVIRLVGRHNYSAAEMIPLRMAFNELNGRIVPRSNVEYKIPLEFKVVDDFGNLVDVTPVMNYALEEVPDKFP